MPEESGVPQEGFKGKRRSGPLAELSWLVVLTYSLMFVVSSAFAAWRGHWTGWFDLVTLGPDAILGVGLGLGVVALSQVATRLGWFAWLIQEFAALVRGLTLWQVVLFAGLSALGEESLFRGVLQSETGLIAATLLFGVAHVGPSRRYLPWTGFALLVGLGLGLLYRHTGTLTAPVAAHATINLINLFYLVRLGEKTEDGANH